MLSVTFVSHGQFNNTILLVSCLLCRSWYLLISESSWCYFHTSFVQNIYITYLNIHLFRYHKEIDKRKMCGWCNGWWLGVRKSRVKWQSGSLHTCTYHWESHEPNFVPTMNQIVILLFGEIFVNLKKITRFFS